MFLMLKAHLRSKRVVWGHNIVRDAHSSSVRKVKMTDFGSRLSVRIHQKSTWRSSRSPRVIFSKPEVTGCLSTKLIHYYTIVSFFREMNLKSFDFSRLSVPVRNPRGQRYFLHLCTPVVHNVQFVLTWKRVISSELHHFLFFFVKLYFSMNL